MKIYIIGYRLDDYNDKLYYESPHLFGMRSIEVSVKKTIATKKPAIDKHIGWDFEGKPLYKKIYINEYEENDVIETINYYGWVLDDLQQLPLLMKAHIFDLSECELKVIDATEDDLVWEARC